MSPLLRRHATTIALSILAFGGAILVLVVDRGSVTTEEALARRKNLFEAFRRDDITELLLSSKGKSARLVRSNAPEGPKEQKQWIVETGKHRERADEASVDQLLNALESAVFERRVPPDSVDKAALGLVNPRASFDLTMAGRLHRVTVGAPAPAPEGAFYAEAEGRGVFVIAAFVASALDVDPERLRIKSINPYTIAELRSFDIEGKGGSRRFTRAPWGGSHGPSFRWNGPTQLRANAAAIERVLIALDELQAEFFLSDDDADRALSKEISITLVSDFADSSSTQIDIGGACPGHPDLSVIIRREPSRLSACVPTQLLNQLAAPAESFVDRSLFAAAIDAVVEVTFMKGDQVLELARKGRAFRMRAPEERDIDGETARTLLETLLALDASPIVETSPPDTKSLGLDKPRATVRLTSTTESRSLDGGVTDERIEVVEVGALNGDVIYVRRVEDGAILAIQANRSEALFPNPIPR